MRSLPVLELEAEEVGLQGPQDLQEGVDLQLYFRWLDLRGIRFPELLVLPFLFLLNYGEVEVEVEVLHWLVEVEAVDLVSMLVTT
jgi:hypothetical protein